MSLDVCRQRHIARRLSCSSCTRWKVPLDRTVNCWRVWSWVMTLMTTNYCMWITRIRTMPCVDRRAQGTPRCKRMIWTNNNLDWNTWQSETWSFTLNKMATTRFTPDAVNSQRRRNKKGGLLERHKTDPPQDHHNKNNREFETRRMCYQRSGCFSGESNYCHYT